MKKFQFRLERVLQYKLTVKEERRQDLALANMNLRAAEDRLIELEHMAAQNHPTPGKLVSFHRYRLTGMYGKRLASEIQEAKELMDVRRREVKEAMERYIEASKESQALETLKKRKRAEHDEEVRMEEDKFLDELTVQRMGRQE